MLISKKTFSKDYLKNYIVQGVSLILRFVSLFIVVPVLSENPELYGVYALCISVVVFLSYVDLGFLTSSIKYASESYSQGNRDEEMNFIGFGGMVTLSMSMLLSIVFFYLSVNPVILIANLKADDSILIASNLLLILSLSSPFIVLKRVISSIFEIRLQGYISKCVNIATSLIVVISTFYFFANDNYLIVEYFVFLNLSGIIGTIIMLIILKKRFSYDLFKLLKSFKFSKKFYNLTKKLAYPSFINMISWVIFYELDQIVVGKFIGAKEVAYFSIGLMFASLFRSIFGIIFGPFLVRANYYVASKDDNGLKQFLVKILIVTAPFTFIPSIAFSLISEPLILSWVGNIYEESILIAKVFSLLFALSFVSYLANIYLTTKERVKKLYTVSVLMPFIYWIGIYLSYSNFGIIVFPILKLLSIIVSVIYFLIILNKDKIVSFRFLFQEIFVNLIISSLVLILLIKFSFEWLPQEKSTSNFLITLTIATFFIMISMVLYYILSKNFQKNLKAILIELKFKQ